jgi:hypothetical protein
LPTLSGHIILIVDSEMDSFMLALQRALEDLGAETVAAQDAETAERRVSQFDFTVAAVSSEFISFSLSLAVPTYVYAPNTRQMASVVTGISELL